MAIAIPISGKAEHGKTTAAIFLKKILEQAGQKVCIINYGDYVKFVCKEYLDWNGEKDNIGRGILQYEGTNYVRQKDYNFWVDTVTRFVKIYEERFDFFLMPDTRFPNEIDSLPEVGLETIALRINRPGHKSILTEEQLAHASETSLDDYLFEYTIEAQDAVELKDGVRTFIRELDAEKCLYLDIFQGEKTEYVR